MKNHFILILCLATLMLSGCSNGKMQTLGEFLEDADIEYVDAVTITDGSTGYHKTTTELSQIEEFLNLVNDIMFSPQKNQEKRVGLRYGITLYEGEKSFHFSLNYINGVYYDSNPDIHPIVDEFYKNLAVEEK